MYDDQYIYETQQHYGGHRRGRHGGGRGHRFHGDPSLGAGPWQGRRPRRRGAARAAILTALKNESPRTGAQILQALAESGLSPNPTRIYALLLQFEDAGLVSSTSTEATAGRSFELTAAGREHLEQLTEQTAGGWPPAGENHLALRRAVFATASAARQVGIDGDQERTAKAIALLDETRKGLYRLLAGEESDAPQGE